MLLPKLNAPPLATALHLAHEVHPDADEQQHRAPAHQQGHQQRTLFARAHIELDVVVDQVTDQATVQIGRGGAHTAVVLGHSHDFGAALAFLDGGGFETTGLDQIKELGIPHGAGPCRGTAIELLEDGEKDHGDHHPHGDL